MYQNMFRKLAVIMTVAMTSFALLINPVHAESFSFDYIDYSQLSDIYDATQEMVNSAGEVVDTFVDVMDKAEDIITIVTVGGTAICVIGSIASTTVFPPAAAILPYCSAIGIIDSGQAVTKAVKKPKQARRAWNILNHAF